MKDNQVQKIDRQLDTIMEELMQINLNIRGIDERQEVLRKELCMYDFNQIKWQLKMEKEVENIEKILGNIDKELSNKIEKLDEKFIREIGKMKSKIGDMQKDIKYLKEYPFIVEARLSLVEEKQEDLISKLNAI